MKQYTNKYKIGKLIPSLVTINLACYWERHLSKNIIYIVLMNNYPLFVIIILVI